MPHTGAVKVSVERLQAAVWTEGSLEGQCLNKASVHVTADLYFGHSRS